MLLSALLLHNVLPGPMLAEDRPEFIPMMSAILFLAAIAVLVCGLFLSKLTVQALRAPVGVLMPAVGLFSVIGAYTLDSSMFNVFYMLGFGVVAYFLEEMGYPIAPLVIGIILGPMADQNIRLALTANQGDLTPFVTRPIALILLGLIAYSLFKRKR
jgi:putative tricarboxylic transport membrane protein